MKEGRMKSFGQKKSLKNKEIKGERLNRENIDEGHLHGRLYNQ
jgi:hypothetical protein